METYDPLQTPAPEEWLALDEGERVYLIEEYHEGEGVELPNLHLHATVHAVVENQLASGDPPEARRAMGRLLRDGLDRHEAVHAVGFVLLKHLHNLMRNTPKKANPHEPYIRDLKNLTAKKWRVEAGSRRNMR